MLNFKELRKVFLVAMPLAAGLVVALLVKSFSSSEECQVRNDRLLSRRAKSEVLPKGIARRVARSASPSDASAAGRSASAGGNMGRVEFAIDISSLTRDVQEALAGMTAEQRKLYLSILSASRNEDFDWLLARSKDVRQSGNADLKGAMIGGLGGMGIAGAEELANYLVDSDDEVVQAALNEFDGLFNELEDDVSKIRLCESTVSLLKDESAINWIMVDMKGCDHDDPQTASAMMAAINRLVAGSNPLAAEAAKDVYEYITDQEYATAAEAMAWAEAKGAASVQSVEGTDDECEDFRK